MKHNRMLVMDNVFYRYRKGEFELRSINIDTTDKNIVCLLGNSGCGKSTILSLIMGLTRVDSGRIVIDNVCLDDGRLFIQPERRNIGVVFQHPSLFPHKTIIENIMFAIKDLDAAKKKISAMEVLEIFNLGCFAYSYPHMLSGGQQQMVTIARAIAQKPKIILMDEPFSSLDFMLRRSTRRKVFEILKGIKTQAILVTHDPEEAVENADFIYVVNKGRIIQGASPDSIYADPGSKYVMNLFDELSCMKIKVEGSVLRTPFGGLDKQHSFSPGSEVEVCFGSDAFVVSDFGQDVIVENHCLFSKYLWFRLDGNVYKMAYSFDNEVPEIGKTIKVTLKKERVFAFPV